MASPRIAPRTPTACAGCRGQYPGRTHVDYRSAIEGPLVDESKPRGARIDWVVLCENCVRSAYELLPAQAERVESYRETVANLSELLAEAQAYSTSLEAAIAARPEREHVHPVVEPVPTMTEAEVREAAALPPKKRKPRYGGQS